MPQNLIAQTPLEPRDSSRLLIYDKKTETVSHKIFKELGSFLKSGDVLVVNETKVIPARLLGQKTTGAHAEVLLLKRLSLTDWEVLLKPAKRLKIGTKVIFSDKLACEIIDAGEGVWTVRFLFEGVF